MSALTKLIKRFNTDESGATAIEYSLLCSLIFLVVVPAADAFAQASIDLYNTLAAAM